MASVRTDDGPQGMRNDFESAAAHLLPYDPVAKKCAASGNKQGSAQILSVGGDEPKQVAVSSATTSKTKSSIGSIARVTKILPEILLGFVIQQCLPIHS